MYETTHKKEAPFLQKGWWWGIMNPRRIVLARSRDSQAYAIHTATITQPWQMQKSSVDEIEKRELPSHRNVSSHRSIEPLHLGMMGSPLPEGTRFHMLVIIHVKKHFVAKQVKSSQELLVPVYMKKNGTRRRERQSATTTPGCAQCAVCGQVVVSATDVAWAK